jgi:acyl-CoA thioesterase-1
MLLFPASCDVAWHWSYGNWAGKVQAVTRGAMVAVACAWSVVAGAAPLAAQDRAVKIVALGDSLTAGFGLAARDAFPAKLALALKAKGIAAEIVNAGVSGDTATGGLERLTWAVPQDADAVILELGANDALRGIDPRITRAAIGTIVRKLRQRHIAVVVCGMLAPPNMGSDYAIEFNLIFPDAAVAYGAIYYPFFLNGIAADPKLNQRDGLHPTAAGVDVIVANILPTVEQLIVWAKSERGS